MTQHIYLVVFDRCEILDFAGPSQVFTTATEILNNDGRPGYSVKLLGTQQMIRTETGIEVRVNGLPRNLPSRSTLLMAGGAGINEFKQNNKVENWFLRSFTQADRYGSVCSGSIALAEWGLLDGKKATSHWSRIPELMGYESVKVNEDALYVTDGKLWTSAGISAGIDMAIAMVAEDHGTTLATRTAQRLVLPSRRSGGQSQYSEALSLDRSDPDAVFEDLHVWLKSNVHKDLKLSDMADFCSVSERTLQRHYAEVFATTPSKTFRRLRLDKARDLLINTKRQISSIAGSCGFNSHEQFTKAFVETYNTTPKKFRDSFSI